MANIRNLISIIMIAAVMMSSGILSVTPQPATAQDIATTTGVSYYVATTGSNSNDGRTLASPFLTITYAISKTIAGDTINVAAGTYAEGIVIDKALTILGAESNVNATGGTWAGNTVLTGASITACNITAANVTFKGFRVNGAGQYGIYIGRGEGPALVADNITIENCELIGNGKYGLQAANLQTGTMNNLVINQVYAHSNARNGIKTVNVNNPTITSCNITGNGGVETGNYGYGIWIDATNDSVAIPSTITGNTFSGNAVGAILLKQSNTSTNHITTGTVISNNIFGNETTKYGINNALTPGRVINAANNFWGTASGPVNASNTYTVNAMTAQGSKVSDNVTFLPWWSITTGTPFVPITNNDSPVENYASFVTAIAGTTAGGIIDAKAGIYTEDFMVNKALTIRGAEWDVDPTAEGSSIPDGGWQGYTVIVAGATSGGTGQPQYAGYSPHLKASNINFLGFKVMSDGTPRAGLYVGGNGEEGIGPFDNVTIANCEFTGRSEAGVILGAMGGLALNNMVIDHVYSHNNVVPVYGASGIKTVNVNNPTISNCLITGNFTGVWITTTNNGVAIPSTITGNTFSGNYYGSIGLRPANTTSSGQDTTGTVINYNNFQDGVTKFGIFNAIAPSHLINGKYNYWGNASGPTITDANLGAVTYGTVVSSDNVTFKPWLIAPFTTQSVATDLTIGTTTPLPAGNTADPYSAPLAASGGVGGTRNWSYYDGSLSTLKLSDNKGLTPAASTPWGTCTTSQIIPPYVLGLQVNDGVQGTYAPYSLIITAGAPFITTTSLPDGEVGQSYNQTVLASGGTGTKVWDNITGPLPPPLTLSSAGVIDSGTLTTAGTYNFTVRVVVNSTIATKDLSIVVWPALTMPAQSVPDGIVSTPYNSGSSLYAAVNLVATGGKPPLVWTTVSGASDPLPAGMTLSSSGLLSGTPTENGTFHVRFTVTDNLSVNDADTLTLTIETPLQSPAIFVSTGTDNGTWRIDTIGDNFRDATVLSPFGRVVGDIPVAIDWYDNGNQDLAIFRTLSPNNGLWFIDKNRNGKWDGEPTDQQLGFFGRVAGDIPLAIDWAGTGTQQSAIFRTQSPNNGVWYIDSNHNGVWDNTTVDTQLGPFGRVAGDIPLAINWIGSGPVTGTGTGTIQDLCIFRPGEGMWYIDTNHSGTWNTGDTQLGPFGRVAGDTPLAIDWNGDGKQELCIYRPGENKFYVDVNRNGVWDPLIDAVINGPSGTGVKKPLSIMWQDLPF